MIFLQTLAANAEPERTTKPQHFHNEKNPQFNTRDDVHDHGKQPDFNIKKNLPTQQNKLEQPVCLLM